MALSARLRELGLDRKGAALVEFTLVAPLLIGLMCGLAEFGQALRQYHVMEKGVRDAARYLAHGAGRIDCSTPSSPAGDTTWTTEVANAQNLAVYGATTAGTALFKGWADPTTVTATIATCLTNLRPTGAPLPQITVTAKAPYVDLGMLSFLGLGPITLSVSHQELKVS